MTMSQPGAESSMPPRARSSVEASTRSGWVTFAGVVLCVAGLFNVINGLTLLSNSDFFVNSYLYDNTTFWGWAFGIWGVLQFVAGVMAVMNRAGGIGLGMLLASIACVLWFFLIFAAPFSALIGIAVNLAVIGGLSTSDRLI